MLQFPGNDNSFFAFADFAAGINLYSKSFIYTPAVRCGVLFPNVEYMYTNEIEILLGNYLRWRYIFLHIEAGVRFDTYKDKGNLVTALEPAWGLTFTVKS